VDGIEVSPSRALEAFWRWEHVCARSTRDILSDSGNCTCLFGSENGQIQRLSVPLIELWLLLVCFAALAIANQLPVEL
jgi:hypothetical protein